MTDRFLPGVPGREIERIFNTAAGNEIASGKFDSPESSAALAANAFGFFLKRPRDLPPLPDCGRVAWPARSLSLEAAEQRGERGLQNRESGGDPYGNPSTTVGRLTRAIREADQLAAKRSSPDAQH